MNANELRIGNWYNWYADSKYYQFQVEPKDFTHGNMPNYEPIPLTEEWLLRFGFEKTEGGGNWNFPLHEIFKDKNFFKVSKLDNYFYWYNQVDDDYYSYMHNIQHVHQLQNLYFALTNEELTLKQ
jgi:hypothetical protein